MNWPKDLPPIRIIREGDRIPQPLPPPQPRLPMALKAAAAVPRDYFAPLVRWCRRVTSALRREDWPDDWPKDWPQDHESRIERVTNADGEAVTGDYDGPLDEVVAFGATVHLEAMSASDHCLIIEAGGERLCINIGARKRGASRPCVDAVLYEQEKGPVKL